MEQKVRMSFRNYMKHYHDVDIFSDTFQRLTKKQKDNWHREYMEFIEPTKGEKISDVFNHSITVDEDHKIHMTQSVFDYYKTQKISRNGIIRDVERMLDEFDVIDYKDCYISIKEDGSWNTKFEGGDYEL